MMKLDLMISVAFVLIIIAMYTEFAGSVAGSKITATSTHILTIKDVSGKSKGRFYTRSQGRDNLGANLTNI